MKEILIYEQLSFWGKTKFHVSLNYNKILHGLSGSRPQHNSITDKIYLGRIPEEFGDLPENFGKNDMVLAVVEPGEILEVNDHTYFERLQQNNIKHHLVPMKDFGSGVNISAAQNGLAQMHNTLSNNGKV